MLAKLGAAGIGTAVNYRAIHQLTYLVEALGIAARVAARGRGDRRPHHQPADVPDARRGRSGSRRRRRGRRRGASSRPGEADADGTLRHTRHAAPSPRERAGFVAGALVAEGAPMRTLARALLVAVPVLPSLACGGRVGLIQGDGGRRRRDGGVRCPAPSDTASPAASARATDLPTRLLRLLRQRPSSARARTERGPVCGRRPGVSSSSVTGRWGSPTVPTRSRRRPARAPSTSSPDEGCAVELAGDCDSDIAVYDCNGNFIGDAQCECFGGSWGCDVRARLPRCVAPPTGRARTPGHVEQGVACFSPFEQCAG